MRRFLALANIGNLALLALAGGVAFLIFVAVDILDPSVYRPVPPLMDEEVYPFSLTPELPVANESDEAALRTIAAAFLAAPEWADVASHPGAWNFADVAVLTRNGIRAGVYGDVAFAEPVSLPGPVAFVRCGAVEGWEREEGPPFHLGGLRIWLLDGEDGPYNVLPLNADGELPTLREVEAYTGRTAACD